MTPRAKSKLIREVLERLRPELSGPLPANGVRRQLQFEAPALVPSTFYDGIDLTEIMTPQCVAEDSTIEEAYSRLAYTLVAPHLVDTPPAWNLLGGGVRDFVDGELTRFVFWASRKRGAALSLSSTHAIVTLESGVQFGIDNGQIRCLYGEYLPKHSATLCDLSKPQFVKTRDKTFIVLFGRATPKDRVFLAAAKLGFHDSFDALAPWLGAKQDSTLRTRVEAALMGERHPFVHLYKILVPTVVTSTRFAKMFGGPNLWDENPTTPTRERAYFRLVRMGLI